MTGNLTSYIQRVRGGRDNLQEGGKDSRMTSWRRQHLAFIFRDEEAGHSMQRKQNHHRHEDGK